MNSCSLLKMPIQLPPPKTGNIFHAGPLVVVPTTDLATARPPHLRVGHYIHLQHPVGSLGKAVIDPRSHSHSPLKSNPWLVLWVMLLLHLPSHLQNKEGIWGPFTIQGSAPIVSVRLPPGCCWCIREVRHSIELHSKIGSGYCLGLWSHPFVLLSVAEGLLYGAGGHDKPQPQQTKGRTSYWLWAWMHNPWEGIVQPLTSILQYIKTWSA